MARARAKTRITTLELKLLLMRFEEVIRRKEKVLVKT